MADWHVVFACVSSATPIPGSIHSVRAMDMLLVGHVSIGVASRSSHAPACTEQVPEWAGGIGWATCGSQRAGMGLQICSRHVARWARHSAENLARLVGLLVVFMAYQAFERQARRQESGPFNVNLFDSCNGEQRVVGHNTMPRSWGASDTRGGACRDVQISGSETGAYVHIPAANSGPLPATHSL